MAPVRGTCGAVQLVGLCVVAVCPGASRLSSFLEEMMAPVGDTSDSLCGWLAGDAVVTLVSLRPPLSSVSEDMLLSVRPCRPLVIECVLVFVLYYRRQLQSVPP